MIWKFWFVVSCVLLILLNVAGYFTGNIEPSIKTTVADNILGYVITALFTAAIGYFYALGWNKKVYSQKLNEALIILSILTGLSILVYNVCNATYTLSPEKYLTPQLYALEIALMIPSIITLSAAVWGIISSPFWVAFIKYKQRLGSLENIENPLWKLFTLFILLGFIAAYTAIFIIKANYLKTYNYWDIYLILVCIYELVFLIGFAFKKKFFNQLFWKISGVIYTLALIPSHFLASQQFKAVMLYKNSWFENTDIVLLSPLFLYALYKYAFGKDGVFQNNL